MTDNRIIELPQAITKNWIEKNSKYTEPSYIVDCLDFSKTKKIDSAGIAFIRIHKNKNKELEIINLSPSLKHLLDTWENTSPTVNKKNNSGNFLEKIGGKGVDFYNVSINAISLLTEIIYWGSFGLLKHKDYKKGALGEQMYMLGFRALGIVGLLSLLIGAVLALQTAMQLKLYGADIFLAPMIAITMIREMGPMLTAIILAGRTGSATTAEIATMGVNEELDALSTMSINPVQYVVVPKLWAITLTMPLLAIFAMSAGILGGYLVAVIYLGTSSSLFIGELTKSIFLEDVIVGFGKTVVFAWLIIWIGAFYGFRTKGGAEQVGKETTSSVVTCIFAVIIADAVFSFLF